MRIFIGYHYGPSDVWVKDYVYRLVRAFGDEVVSGEALYLGPNIVQAIDQKIQECDALIGVASRRKQQLDGYYTTHDWVKDELSTARAHNKHFVQLRETGLDPAMGILEGAQYIDYDAADLAGAMVKLTEALGQWHSLRNVQIYLLPRDFRESVNHLLDDPGFVCRATILNQRNAQREYLVRPMRLQGALGVVLNGVSNGDRVKLEASFGPDRWVSDFESVESPSITMTPLNPAGRKRPRSRSSPK